MRQKDGEKWTAASALQPTLLLPYSLLVLVTVVMVPALVHFCARPEGTTSTLAPHLSHALSPP